MGIAVSRCYTKHIVEPRELRARICVLEEEMKELRSEKEKNEHLFSLQRRKHKEEVAMLRRKVEEEEEMVRRLEMAAGQLPPATAVIGGKEWEWRPRLERDYVVERMREEQARKEAAVDKWKQLYLAIKTELDELIVRTNEGGQFCWGSAQGAMVESLQKELKAKEEALEALRAKLMTMEREGERKEREIDIVRQSLKILSNTKRNRGRRNMKRILHM
ncbi:hypothetical protein KFK09_010716 [Dendrobium nobile]|uniref:Uncharacterized protein n=1 Tax=Dendrobium nobile TaxID=94219 RepID=A0A8T3BAT1_DENNO|nr:hypothetical protein KFK09_010716 [Dendrobium nobile]